MLKLRWKLASANARWPNQWCRETFGKAVSELEKAMQNLRRKLHTVALVSGEPYTSLVNGCINDVAPF